MNNFFLYQYGGQNRFVFIPWDKETCLQAASWPVLQRVETNVLTRRLLADPANQASYVAALRRAAAFVNARWLLPHVEPTYTQIREAALIDTKKPVDNDTFELAIGGLRGVDRGARARHPGAGALVTSSRPRGRARGPRLTSAVSFFAAHAPARAPAVGCVAPPRAWARPARPRRAAAPCRARPPGCATWSRVRWLVTSSRPSASRRAAASAAQACPRTGGAGP